MLDDLDLAGIVDERARALIVRLLNLLESGLLRLAFGSGGNPAPA